MRRMNMNKILVLVDNDQEELNKLKSLITQDETKETIKIVDIFIEEYDENALHEIVIERINELINLDPDAYFHIVIDACLSEEDQERSELESNVKLSGVECAESIVLTLRNNNCSFIISLMSRFFITQLDSYNPFIDFSENETNNFYAVIRKPIVDSGDIDTGLSPIPQYTDKLPEKYLSRKYSIAFRNIVLYKLLEDEKDEI